MKSSEADNIDKLNKNFEILRNAKDNISAHEKEYREIIEAVKGSDEEKLLALQLIPKFFSSFPSLADAAVDASIYLCEDKNIQIRREVIYNLVLVCQCMKQRIPEIVGILARIPPVYDARAPEVNLVHTSLQCILKLDTKAALAGIFGQFLTGDALTRDRCFKILGVKLKQLGKEIITDEIEAFIIEELKKVLQDVTTDEFQICMNILASTKLGTTPEGQRELVALAVKQAELNTEEESVIIEDKHVERYILCANHALPYFSTQIESTPFIKYACDKLFPLQTWKLIGANDSGHDQLRLRVLKAFAEMTAFCGTLDAPNQKIDAIFKVLQDYIPLPSITEGDEAIEENLSFKFSHAECLLYALHKLGKQDVGYFQFKDDPKKLAEFSLRWKYLDRGAQGYIKKLQETVKDETISNISTLIRDFSHNPPTFCSVVQLSWITKNSNYSNKRHAPITFQSDANNDAKRKKINEEGLSEDCLVAPIAPWEQHENEIASLRSELNELRARHEQLLTRHEQLLTRHEQLLTRHEHMAVDLILLQDSGRRCTCGVMAPYVRGE